MEMPYKNIEYILYEGLVQIQEILVILGLDEDLLKTVAESKNLIRNKKYTVAVMGEFRRGKSSLINALLGGKILPADATPTTATINRITYGDHPGALITYKNGETQKIDISQLCNYITKITSEDEARALKIQEATVFYPTVICQNHIDIIDTPGLNDEDHMTQITIDMVNHVDAVILPIHARSPFSETEKKFICQLILSRNIQTLVVVVTFLDQLDEDEYEYGMFLQAIGTRIRQNVLQELVKRNESEEIIGKAHAMLDNLNIYGISSKLALTAFMTNNLELLHKSHFEEFKTALTRLVTAGQLQNACEKAIESIRLVVSQLQAQNEKKAAALCSQLQQISLHREAVLRFCMERNRMLNTVFAQSYAEISEIIAGNNALKNTLAKNFINRLTRVKINSHELIRIALQEAADSSFFYVNNTHGSKCRGELMQAVASDADKLKIMRTAALEEHLEFLQMTDHFDPAENVQFANTVLHNIDFSWAVSPIPNAGDLTKVNVIETVVNAVDCSVKQYIHLFEAGFAAIRKNWFNRMQADAECLSREAMANSEQLTHACEIKIHTQKTNFDVLFKKAENIQSELETQWGVFSNSL